MAASKKETAFGKHSQFDIASTGPFGGQHRDKSRAATALALDDGLADQSRPATAVLRWRTRWLKHSLSLQEANALRFVPALLQASFPAGDLRGEPPGIEGVAVRRSWGGLARSFDLPPPIARQRGRRLILALFAMRHAHGLEIFVLPAPQLGAGERHLVEQRVATVESFFRLRNVALKMTMLSWEKLDHATDPLIRIMPFGALIAGKLPSSFWPANPGQTVSPADLAKLINQAPTRCASIAILLMASASPPVPAETLRSVLRLRQSAVDLADPDIFTIVWSGIATQEKHSNLLFNSLAYTARSETTREIAARRSGIPFEANSLPGTATVLKLGRAISIACASAVRCAPRPTQTILRAWLGHEILSRGLPPALLELLARSLKGAADSHRRGPLLKIRRAGKQAFEACDPSGTCLGRGISSEQAQTRAMALLALAFGESPPLDDPVWRTLSERLAKPASQRTLLLAVEPAAIVGAPHDPLNRGPERMYGFSDTLAVLTRPGGRPSARRLYPEQVLERVMAEAARGTSVEALVTSGEAHPAAARLMRVAHLCRKEYLAAPLALEAGGRVFLVEPSQVKRYPLKRFAARPRLCAPDPEAPDLSPFAEENLGKSPFSGNRMTITCQVVRLGENKAAILYVDPHGYQLHEEVPLTVVEQHLADAQAVLRAGAAPMLLAIRYSSDLDGMLGRFGLSGTEARVYVEIKGKLPFGLEVLCSGERFGGSQPLNWSAAAQAVLSAWPSGERGIVCAKVVSVEIGRRPAAGLMRLYARSVALRRLALHLARAGRE